MGKSISTGNPTWRLGRFDNLPQPLSDAFGPGKVGKGILGVPRLADNLEVGIIVLIKFNDALNHRVIAPKIVVIDKAGRIKVSIYLRIAPVDGQGVGSKRVGDLFSDVTRV